MGSFKLAGLTALLVLAAGSAGAADAQEGKSLNNYRLQAVLPSVCSQIGGITTYNGHTSQCQMPTVTSGKAPTQGHIEPPHVAPVTTKR